MTVVFRAEGGIGGGGKGLEGLGLNVEIVESECRLCLRVDEVVEKV